MIRSSEAATCFETSVDGSDRVPRRGCKRRLHPTDLVCYSVSMAFSGKIVFPIEGKTK